MYVKIGGQIREARMTQGLTQTELANYLGLTRSSVANIESGRQGLTVHVLLRIHGLLGLAFRGLAPEPEQRVDAARQRALVRENAELKQRITAARKALGSGGGS